MPPAVSCRRLFPIACLAPTNEDILWEHQCKIITELAEKGPCVIVGRAQTIFCGTRQIA